MTATCETCQKQAAEIERLQRWHDQRNSYIEHPAQDLTKWRVYDRMPIQTSYHTVILIQLFERHDHFNDLWVTDHPDGERMHYELFERAARQFHRQLEGHDCIAFWQALKAEAEREIERWELAKRSRTS